MQTIDLSTTRHSQMVPIADQVAALIPSGFNGAVVVFCRHTTAAVTINENADPDVVHDMLAEFKRLVPWENAAHRHAEGNSGAHVKASLIGESVTVPVRDGHLALGTWQGIFFCEFDGPRSRQVVVQLLPAC